MARLFTSRRSYRGVGSAVQQVTFAFYWSISLILWLGGVHTSTKLIEIRQNGHPKRHGLYELGCQMESDDTLHVSGGVLHWVLEPKNSKFGPMGQKFSLKKFFA